MDNRQSIEHFITAVMANNYPYQYYNCPIPFSEWSTTAPVNPLYTVPIPIIVNPPPVLSTPICPYMPPGFPSIMGPVAASSAISPLPSYHESIFEMEPPGRFYGNMIPKPEDPLEYYLSLPKNIFPSARMVNLDPNVMIDQLCKLSNVDSHVPWLLDLEFGIPKIPITRPIPCYNVKFNSIHWKNTPDAIHPGFESCSQDFKRVLLFYYDYVVSRWYRGFVFLNRDKSVENFQSWLMFPMQELGMSWS